MLLINVLFIDPVLFPIEKCFSLSGFGHRVKTTSVEL